MVKHALCAAFLASACAGAHAGPDQHWRFSYTGFYDEWADVFLPNASVSGLFVGDDADNDGVIERSEISRFAMYGYELINCDTEIDPYMACSLSRFSYALGGELTFDAYFRSSDPEYMFWYERRTNSGLRDYANVNPPWNPWRYSYLWTPETRFSIVATVPEPGSYAMLAAGLLGLAGVSRLRGRRGRVIPAA